MKGNNFKGLGNTIKNHFNYVREKKSKNYSFTTHN